MLRTCRFVMITLALPCNALMAHTQPPIKVNVPDDVELLRDVEFGKGGERGLKLHILRPKTSPKEPLPVLVYINGGGWSTDNKDMGIARLILAAQQGYFCVTIEHRLVVEKKGNPPAPLPAQIEDCKCAVRYLRAKAKEYHLDTKRIGAWGGSSGGHLAALLGTSTNAKDLDGTGGWPGFSSQVHAVCSYCPPTDLLAAEWPEGMKTGLFTRLLGGHPKDKMDLAVKASPITYITKDSPPFLIMHGDKDGIVPFKQGERLYLALKKAGVEVTFETVKGKGHEELDPRNEFAMKFFNKHFKSSGK